MNGKATMSLAGAALLCASGCEVMVARRMTISESTQCRAVIEISTTNVVILGIESERSPHITISVTGEGKNMAYRNRPGTTFAFGRDFDVNIDWCSGGYLWVSEDGTRLGVALFDPEPPTGFMRLTDFNGCWRITRAQADLLLKKR
ncbi:MAG: hypothetical protein FJ290_12260 [Planctomycetes bacterium]|nr:hypothetical protein [Planctomycetota bacterium]